MAESVNESISVALWSNHTTNKIMPYSIYWHGRRYQIKDVGLHHIVREGRTLFHMFSVTDGTTFFRLQFNTETLLWKLLEVDNVDACGS